VRAVPTGQYGRDGQKVWRGQTYKDPKYAKWQRAAMPYFGRERPEHPLEGPLALSMVAVLKFRETDRRKTRFVPRKWHTARPDMDNVMKAIMDCAQNAGWFANDWQVVRVLAEKVYAAQGEEPSLSVIVVPIETPYHVR